ncbi:hypothetical protein ACHAXA_005023 [Cyclostephanos tholiformis]|uniref:RNA exonuclease 4 n=1 Tax=Cyclostephanos tholiformis TaxID=382380 RepID=A0ABD3RYS4_9STRA
MMSATTSSITCPTIKANSSLRRAMMHTRNDVHPAARDIKSSSHPVIGVIPPPKKSRRRRPRKQNRNPSSRDDSTASTEPSSSSDDGRSSPPPLDVSPNKTRRNRNRRSSTKSIGCDGHRTPGTMVVSIPSASTHIPSSSPSSSSRDDIDGIDDACGIDDGILLPDANESRCLAIDCEMVGIGPCGRTSRLARVVALDHMGDVVYDAHVRTTEVVTDYRTGVSGITPEDLLETNGAVSFDEARGAMRELIRDRIIVGHGLKNDLYALGIWDHPWYDIRDTARYEPFMRPVGPNEYNPTNATRVPKKLRTLAKDKLNMTIQVEGMPHDPIEDALAALCLYRRHRIKWENAIRYKVERTREISSRGMRSSSYSVDERTRLDRIR